MRTFVLQAMTTLLLSTACFSPGVNASCVMDISPPCQAYWNAPVVFIGRVTEVAYSPTFQKGKGEERWNYRRRIARFTVEESFRGSASKQVEVVALETMPTPVTLPDGSPGMKEMSGSDCEYDFEQGETYLVYADRAEQPAGALRVGLNRTRPLAEANDDLEFIRGLAHETKPGATVYGKILRRDRNLNDGNSRPVGGVADVKVTLNGNSRDLKTTTDMEGHYRFTDLPAGTYSVKATMPLHLMPVKEASQARVAQRGCAEVDFYTEVNGRVSGRVFDAQGQPVSKMKVDLVLAELENERHPQSLLEFTDKRGAYEQKGIPPGRYHLGIRLTGINDPNFPYPRIYYPGVQETAKAAVIEIAEGEHLQNYDLHLPPPLAERKIEGVVVWPDGQPAAGASVSLTITEYEYNFAHGRHATTDEQGRFTVKAFEELKYWIGAVVATKRHPGGQMHAEPIDIPANGHVGGVRLVVESPMGNCPRCRDRIWRPSKKQSKQN